MSVRRLCLMSFLIAGVSGCAMCREWFAGYKAADQAAAAKRNPDWNKPRISNELPGTD